MIACRMTYTLCNVCHFTTRKGNGIINEEGDRKLGIRILECQDSKSSKLQGAMSINNINNILINISTYTLEFYIKITLIDLICLLKLTSYPQKYLLSTSY